MPDFSRRSYAPEIMDDLAAKGPDLRQALRELDIINYALGGNRVTMKALEEILKSCPTPSSLHIADLGCGSGDMLRRIRRWLESRKQEALLTGFDANPNVIGFALDSTDPASGIRYEAMDIFSEPFQKKKFDIAVATLFFHHFTDDELTRFFSQLRSQLKVALIINDIHRHWFAYYSIKWLTTAFSHSAMVRHDAPLSVLRAFKRGELLSVLRRAGFSNVSIRWRWAFRWQVIARC